MASTRNGKTNPRGQTGSGIKQIKHSARRATAELENEQAESVLGLAEALGEINEGEALAHLDMRLGLLERQVERLAARRDEADRGFEGELEVMRARLDDALGAVSETAGEMKDAIIDLERRMAALISSAEERGESAREALQSETARQLAEATGQVETKSARLKGEVNALEASMKEQLSMSLTSLSDAIKTSEELGEGFAAKVEEIQTSMSAEIADLRREASERLEADSDLAARIDFGVGVMEQRIQGLDDALTGGIDDLRAESSKKLERVISELKAEAESRLEEASSEARRGFEAQAALVGRNYESLRRHLESSGRELTAALSEATTDLSNLKARTEDVRARFSEADARQRTERAAAAAALEGLARRLEMLEGKIQSTGEDPVVRSSARLQTLEERVSRLAAQAAVEDERAGASEFLARRVGQVAGQVEEALAKVNAIGRWITRPGKAPLPDGLGMPAGLAERLAAIEQIISRLPDADTVEARIAVMEDRLSERGPEPEPMPPHPTVVPGWDLLATQDILPDRKRRT